MDLVSSIKGESSVFGLRVEYSVACLEKSVLTQKIFPSLDSVMLYLSPVSYLD